MDAPAVVSDDSAGRAERRDAAGELLAVRRPALFQLRLHFVLKERIGIDEIGAEQLLTIGLHRASASSIHLDTVDVMRSGRTLSKRLCDTSS
ncbi:hypothetical protein [Bradyrhizobium sp. LTSP849]|jgi:hypothetical protein|uniref:hypothetical protein n=1 Tax=Bradyrhizobium sp. LTSP849 TaxID=1615890 RepID=UPI001AEC2DAC|nr:hypothetical protein [Bradyrhizobium sp. LTSP849]